MEIDNKLLLENSKDLSVLYIEDDIELQKSTLKFFLNFFEDIDCAKDGTEGLSKYKEQLVSKKKTYDIVISDINMPNMNGIEMSKHIKVINPDQVIIIITAFNEVEYLNDAIDLGIKGFLTKPLEINSLKKVLYQVTQALADKKILLNHYDQIEELNMLHIDKIDASSYSSSKDILIDLETHKEEISRLWTSRDTVHERLGKYYIDIEFFRTHYAIKVIEYFLSVIRGENKAGNCPVIFIMLDFFKNKNLLLEDIFMVCVLFKNTVSAYIFNKYSFNHTLFNDISNILDKNFEGVIINYLDLQYMQKVEKNKNVEKEINKISNEKDTKINLQDDISYAEYVLEHDIYELQDLEEDIDSLAVSVTARNQSTNKDFIQLGSKITRYGSILNTYPIFSDLGKYITKLGTNFSSNAELLFEEKERMLNISALIEGFVNDLIVWRREVFDNNIANPHFLDQSFFSNVDTIIMFIEYDESIQTQDSELEDMFF